MRNHAQSTRTQGKNSCSYFVGAKLFIIISAIQAESHPKKVKCTTVDQ